MDLAHKQTALWLIFIEHRSPGTSFKGGAPTRRCCGQSGATYRDEHRFVLADDEARDRWHCCGCKVAGGHNMKSLPPETEDGLSGS